MADLVSFKFESAKTSRGTDGRQSYQTFVFLMKFEQCIQIHVADAVAIGHHESPFVDHG